MIIAIIVGLTFGAAVGIALMMVVGLIYVMGTEESPLESPPTLRVMKVVFKACVVVGGLIGIATSLV